MTSEQAKDIEMEFRDVFNHLVNKVPEVIGSRRHVSLQRQRVDGEFMYQRREKERLGIHYVICDGMRVAKIQLKPHKVMDIYRAYDADGCFLEKTLERIMHDHFPTVTVTTVDGE